MTLKLVPFAGLVALALVHGVVTPVHAQQLSPFRATEPFTSTLSNNVPIAFGMTPEDVAAALGSPLGYVSGRPGNEMLVAVRSLGGSGFFPRKDRLYLQFRAGRLTGWKGDWGHDWMWQ